MKIFLLLIFFISGCATVEIAREVTKAGESIKASVDKIIKNPNKKKDKKEIYDNSEDNKDILIEQKKIEDEKAKDKELINKQKKIKEVVLLNKSIESTQLRYLKPSLVRIDKNVEIVRYDSNFCKIFLFLNKDNNKPKIEYFELRDNSGELVKNKEETKECYKELNLIN